VKLGDLGEHRMVGQDIDNEGYPVPKVPPPLIPPLPTPPRTHPPARRTGTGPRRKSCRARTRWRTRAATSTALAWSSLRS
jgi:hypothetical protein